MAKLPEKLPNLPENLQKQEAPAWNSEVATFDDGSISVRLLFVRPEIQEMEDGTMCMVIPMSVTSFTKFFSSTMKLVADAVDAE